MNRDNATSSISAKVWCIGILAVAVALRLFLYTRHPTLFLDEAMLAVNLRDASWTQMFHPLPYYDQSSPLVFLLLGKLSFILFGASDWTARLVPLICSIGSVALVLAPWGIPWKERAFVASCIAINADCLRYSTVAKQYGPEILFSLCLYLACRRLLQNPTNANLALYAGACLLCIFSITGFPIVFAGSLIAMLLLLPREMRWKTFSCGATLGTIYGAYYVLALKDMLTVQPRNYEYAFSSLSYPPTNLLDLRSVYRWMSSFVNCTTPDELYKAIGVAAFLIVCTRIEWTRKTASIAALAVGAIALLAIYVHFVTFNIPTWLRTVVPLQNSRGLLHWLRSILAGIVLPGLFVFLVLSSALRNTHRSFAQIAFPLALALSLILNCLHIIPIGSERWFLFLVPWLLYFLAETISKHLPPKAAIVSVCIVLFIIGRAAAPEITHPPIGNARRTLQQLGSVWGTQPIVVVAGAQPSIDFYFKPFGTSCLPLGAYPLGLVNRCTGQRMEFPSTMESLQRDSTRPGIWADETWLRMERYWRGDGGTGLFHDLDRSGYSDLYIQSQLNDLSQHESSYWVFHNESENLIAEMVAAASVHYSVVPLVNEANVAHDDWDGELFLVTKRQYAESMR